MGQNSSAGRVLPLFDPASSPQSWNERMRVGEFAVLYGGVGIPPAEGIAPGQRYCVLFPELEAAIDFATEQAAEYPGVTCTIYDHDGMGKSPVREVRGAAYRGPSELSQGFRRWGGLTLVVGGILLAGADWITGFRIGWAGIVGARLIPPGLLLLMIELGIVLNAWQRRRAAGRA